jgi:nucleotide-binding universal stress UspA family protein
MQILAATDFSTRSNRALRQAGLLAQSSNVNLNILHVVDDDQPAELVHIEKREAERLLSEQVGAMPELRDTQAIPIVVVADPFDGILRVANEIQPTLIVMGSHRKQLLRDIFIGTTVERVIRKGSYPVLMVNHEAQRRYERVVAPIDMSEASANALRAALHAGVIGPNGATLLHAFDAPDKGKMFVGDSDQASIDRYVASERQRAMDELAAFLVAKDLKNIPWSFHLEEDAPMEAISRAVSVLRPDLIVMGTHGRSALVKALMGSVTEEALRSLNVDILAVPPVRR